MLAVENLRPGVRLGYLTASSPELFERIVGRRYDAGPNTLAAAITAEYLEGRLWEHCEMANDALKAKRDAMLAALDAELGNTCSWSRPPGGLFIWVRLPDDIDLGRLETLAAEHEVGYQPGSDFHVDGKVGPYIRLAFGFARRPRHPRGHRAPRPMHQGGKRRRGRSP